MLEFSFPGTYEDRLGRDQIRWQIRPYTEPGWPPGFEVFSSIRGIIVRGRDFDGLFPEGNSVPAGDRISVGERYGEVTDCVLTGDLPCVLDCSGIRQDVPLRFSLDLRSSQSGRQMPNNLRLAIAAQHQTYEVFDDWFEDGVQRLEAQLPTWYRLRCCVTCLFSDYSPGGHGLMGMNCHRGAQEQYLEVRSKADYWSVPITEEVPETYLCPEYARRVAGTGYRG